MKNLCKHFSGGGNFKHPVTSFTKGTVLSLLLAACTATFTACSNEESLSTAGNQLQLSFGINAPQSRAIFTDTKLPDGKPVGVRLDGYTDYANLVYTGTTSGSKQTWTSTTSVTLTDTKGTLYAYWPQSNSVSIDAIDMDMTATDQTDWLYATPVTEVNEDKASVAVTMNHALANINVKVNKGSYLGAGNITNITVQSDGIALGGTFNAAQAKPDYTAFEDEGKPLSRTVTTTAGGTATDIMVVPTGTSAAVTFLLTIDGIQFTATSAAVQLAMGNSYQYTLNLSDISTYMEISGFSVKPWTTVTGGALVLEKVGGGTEDDIDSDYIVCTYNIPSAGEHQLLSNSGYNITGLFNNESIDFSESPTFTFSSPGTYTFRFKLGEGETVIYSSLFKEITSLVSIKLPTLITGIGEMAFDGCTGLTGELRIPDSVTSIGYNAFYNCGITSLHLGKSIKTISSNAFLSCRGLTGELVIPNSVTSIGNRSFAYCAGLTGKLVIPNSMTMIDGYAFSGCSGFTALELGSSVMTIRGGAFEGCTGLSGTLVIPNSVSSIGGGAFYQCSNINTVYIGSGLKTISSDLFFDCTSLSEINIGSSVTSIEECSFRDLPNLSTIRISAQTAPTLVGQVFLYIKEKGKLIVSNGCIDAYASWMSSTSGTLGYYKWTISEMSSSSVDKFTFTIDGQIYQADANMTWSEWVASNYNTSSFICQYGYILKSDMSEVIITEYDNAINPYSVYESSSVNDFSVNGVSYLVAEGMTWAQWVTSNFNTDGYYIRGNVVLNSDNLKIDGAVLNSIIDKSTYTVSQVKIISFTVGGVTYQAEEGMTWNDWVASDYNTSGFMAFGTVYNGAGIALNGVTGSDVIKNGYSYSYRGMP